MPPILGLDLGQKSDPSALVGLEQTSLNGKNHYAARLIERFHLGTPYPAIVDRVVDLLDKPVFVHATLVVDETGVGTPVTDMFRQQLDRLLIPITITSGHRASRQPDGSYHVPKKELVGVVQVLLEHRRLLIAKELENAELLVKELLNFKVKITAAANEKYEAWRDGDHDDLVLALAVAAWAGEHTPIGIPEPFGVDKRKSYTAAPEGVFLETDWREQRW